MIDMIESEETANRVGKYLKRMLTREQPPLPIHHRGTERAFGRGRGGFPYGTAGKVLKNYGNDLSYLITNNTELSTLSEKIFLHLYDLRVWHMKVLITIVLLLAVWAGYPLEVMAQQANTAVSRVATPKDKEKDSVEISAYDNKIVVENAPAGSKLEIYSVVGIRVKEIPMKQPSGEYTVDIAKGYYIVRIGDTVRKVSIR